MLSFALRNLLSRPVRSALAWLGLTVAVAGMVGLFSISAGLRASLERSFGQVPGLIVLQPGAAIPVLSRLPSAWAREIEKLPGVRTVCVEQWARAHLIEGQPAISPPRLLFGMDLSHVLRLKRSIFRDAVIAGRFFELGDVGRPVAVISRPIADEHHKKIGDKLHVDGTDLEIIGIYETRSLLIDLAILIDGNVCRQIAPQDQAICSAMYVEPDGTVPVPELKENIRQHFVGRKGAAALTAASLAVKGPLGELAGAVWNALNQPPRDVSGSAAETGNEDGVQVFVIEEWGREVEKYSSDLDLFLVLINSIGAAIAFLSILNTMLMSVSERLVEFGVLRANGWSRRHVMRLILFESAMIGGAAGLSGVMIGWFGTLVVNWYFRNRVYLYASPLLLSACFAFSIVLGMLGGLYPAWWAIQRSPMDAIRRG